MLVPNQLIKVKVIGSTLQHYKSLGHDVKCFDDIVVPPEHLTPGSQCIVDIICDVCKEHISRPYKEYLKHHTNGFDTCNKCKDKKAKETCRQKYGVETHMLVPEVQQKMKDTIKAKYNVDNISQLDEIKEKKKNTCMKNFGVSCALESKEIQEKIRNTLIDKYGCVSPMQNPDIRAKAEQTNIERYGTKYPTQSDVVASKIKETNLKKYGTECVFQNDDIKKKIAQTNLEKYGAENPFSSDEVKNKIVDTNLQKYGTEYFSQTEEYLQKVKQTNLLKFGYENPNQNPEIKAKSMQTMLEHGSVKTSKQQILVYKTIKLKYPNAVLNYQFSSLALDVFIETNNIKIDCEYDAWYYHSDKQQDIRRDKFLQSQGFKILRIRSGHKIPADQELFDAIDYLINTDHHFIEIILPDWKEADKNEPLFDSTAI